MGLRSRIYGALSSSRNAAFAPLRVPGDLLLRVNASLGRPLAPDAELQARKEAQARLEHLRATRAADAPAAAVQAPVVVYYEKDRNSRLLGRIEEILRAKNVMFTKLDVHNDESAMSFVRTQAKCDADQLPIVFVADHAVGDYNALVAADVAGDFAARVWPAAPAKTPAS